MEGQVAGFGVIRSNPLEGSDAIAELGLFQVEGALRGKGIGAGLHNSIESKLKARGTRKLYTTTNPRNIKAVRFWIGQGFEFEARRTKLNLDTNYYLLSKML
jgi:GNAT superfamily N-acetyltransferase